jgi:hypothetical protein
LTVISPQVEDLHPVIRMRQAIEQCARTVGGTVINEDDLGGLREAIERLA